MEEKYQRQGKYLLEENESVSIKTTNKGSDVSDEKSRPTLKFEKKEEADSEKETIFQSKEVKVETKIEPQVKTEPMKGVSTNNKNDTFSCNFSN